MRKRIRKWWPREWAQVPVAWTTHEPNFVNTRTNSHSGIISGLRYEWRRTWKAWGWWR